jgi:outer membrane lipoprotein
MRRIRWTIASSLVLLLTACATAPPLNLSGADSTLTPDAAVANIDSARGRRVAWGGTIVATHNLKDVTEVEVLGYPLQRSGQPDVEAKALHRFLIVRTGYLESADYRPGRVVTAVGDVTGTRHGKVGEASYVYPVLQADELYLWPTENVGRGRSNVQFGIGLGVIVH